MKIIPAIAARHAEHRRWRHALHAQPELAYVEHLTADFVAARLEACGIAYVRGLGRTGIVATIEGHSPGRRVGLRADMDALPLQEMNDFAHRSQNAGVMHACGHDGHTVMLLAAAEYLARERAFHGTVHCIFQPAEEGEAGAKAMMDDGLFERFPMDAVFGLHNWPWLPMGQMAVRAGPMMASMDIFEATVRGRGGHAAQPHLAIDSIVVAAAIVQAWQTIVARNVDPLESGVVSVTQIHAGRAWAVIPEEVSLRGTVRTFNPAVQVLIEQRLRELGEGLAAAHGCTFDWRYERRFPATINSVAETDFAAAVASELLGADNILRDAAPSMGSEDFGWMLQVKPGSYVWLGTGGETSCLLHNPRYDFNDAAIPVGASYWVALAQAFLNP
ncbi:MAG: amidohydrolase [Gammaproteobacteria bacterium]|nr:amidohydrolase [Gammaproteobacteria bacterium]